MSLSHVADLALEPDRRPVLGRKSPLDNPPHSQAACQSIIFPRQPVAELSGLTARISRSREDIALAQKLRFEVFYQEMGARNCAASGETSLSLDMDAHDAHCHHLLVEDASLAPGNQVVATCRFLLQASLPSTPKPEHGFYSRNEFDIAPMLKRQQGLVFMELGRSCVRSAYRGKRTIELLWAAIWACARFSKADVMFGCASFDGTVPARHAEALSFLHHHRRATGDWAVDGHRDKTCTLDWMPAEAINPRQALRAMPPLIRGYLRLGAMVGNHAFVDRQFATTDVLIILPVSHLNPRYVNYYGENASRHVL